MVSAISKLAQASDPKKAILREVGDLSDIDVFHNHLLVGTYIENERTAGGIIKPDKTIGESRYQGKVGLVLKRGPQAFVDDASVKFHGQNVKVGDWIIFRFADAWEIFIRGVSVRFLFDTDVKAVVSDPSIIY